MLLMEMLRRDGKTQFSEKWIYNEVVSPDVV
jgi:hypothetical protein